MGETGNRIKLEIEYVGNTVLFVLPSKEDHISRTLLSTKSFYERPMLEALAPMLEQGDLVIDVGANIGNHTLFFAKVLKCRVMAFEAVPAIAELLLENVDINGVSGLVEVRQVALGERSGKANIEKYDPFNLGGTTLAVDASGDIDMRALDEIEIQGPVRLIKIDVEGMDLAVLKGARKILANDRPWVICEAADNGLYRPIRKFMERAGYTPTAVYNATDTFLFLPSRSDEERKQLLERGFLQMMAMQREERLLAARLEQTARYSERIKKETIAEVDRQLERQGRAVNERPENLKEPLDDIQVANMFLESALQEKSAELADARAALLAERGQAASQLADAKRRAEEYKKEVAMLLERIAQARLVLDQQRSEGERLAAALADSRIALQEAMGKIAELSMQISKRDGLIARRDREIDDKQRRIAGAHQALQVARGHATDVNRTLDEIRASVSFKLGALVVGSLRSPLRAITLVWTVPALFWKEWWQRRARR